MQSLETDLVRRERVAVSKLYWADACMWARELWSLCHSFGLHSPAKDMIKQQLEVAQRRNGQLEQSIQEEQARCTCHPPPGKNMITKSLPITAPILQVTVDLPLARHAYLLVIPSPLKRALALSQGAGDAARGRCPQGWDPSFAVGESTKGATGYDDSDDWRQWC